MENENDNDTETTNITNTVPTVRCSIMEFDGEGEWGTRRFLTVPQRGSVIELWTEGVDLLARVEETRHVELDKDGNGGDIILFVTKYEKK